MASAVSCADAELVAAGVEFRTLRDLLIEARRLGKPCGEITDAMDPVFNQIIVAVGAGLVWFAWR
jgi:hypothetical protein